MKRALLPLCLSLLACSSSAATAQPPTTSGDAAPEAEAAPIGPRPVPAGTALWESAGPHPVGHASFTATDPKRSRTLPMRVWYPAAASAKPAADTGVPIEELLPAGERRTTLAKLVAEAPQKCIRRRAKVAPAADAASMPTFPLLVFSHCHSCLAIYGGTIAERLASHGFVVAAPDHTGNTLYEGLAGTSATLDGKFLAERAADVRFVIDTMSNATSGVVPGAVKGKLDPDRVGVFGHSFGAATTGLVLETDARVKAGVAIAAPMENDLLPPAKMANIKVPAMFLLAREDNSISEIGNNLIRSNFKRGNPPLWLLETIDAGHWSFSDLVAVTPSHVAGCGEGTRQTEVGESFFYLENEGARALAASYVTAFFAAHLGKDAAAKTFLSATHPSGVVTATVRE